eukprot:12424497-Karenia_brevis.AAC.1
MAEYISGLKDYFSDIEATAESESETETETESEGETEAESETRVESRIEEVSTERKPFDNVGIEDFGVS